MADQTIKVNRNELQAVFRNPRLVRAIEDLINSTQFLFPEQVVALTIAIEESAQVAGSAAASADTANAIAQQALNEARALSSGPTPIIIQPAEVSDDITGRLAHLEAVVSALARRVSDIEERPLP